MTITKFDSQLKIVDTAFAWIRVRRFVNSAGNNHVIPNHPIPKKLLKTNNITTAVMP